MSLFKILFSLLFVYFLFSLLFVYYFYLVYFFSFCLFVCLGGYSRDVTSNLPMLNLPENWPHLPASGHSMLSTNAPATQGQYSMWVGGPMSNISSNQSCAMPYLRTSSNPYTLPSTSTSVPNVQTTAMNTVQPSYESTCDMSGSFPGRDTTGRSSWGHMPTSL